MVKMTRISQLFFLLLILNFAGTLRGIIPSGQYYIYYPYGGSSPYYYPVGGNSYGSSSTKIPVSIYDNGSYCTWSYNGSSFSGWASSYHVVSPAVPNNSTSYFQLQPVAGTTTTTYSATCNGYSATSTTSQAAANLAARVAWLTAKMPTGTTVTAVQDYTVFGWQANPSPSSNIKINFTATATADMYIALRYAASSWIKIILGGWGNTQSCVCATVNGADGPGTLITTRNPVIPDTVNPIAYSLTVNGGVLTITATTSTGATSTILSFANASMLTQNYIAYSFATYDGTNTFRVSGNTFITSSFTGTYSAVYNGVTQTATATSTVSQADANAKAQTAWNTQYPTYTGTYSGVYNGSTVTTTATSTVSQADANTKAQTAWNTQYSTVPNGWYTILYPGNGNTYVVPSAGSVSFVATPTPVQVTVNGAYYTLSYNGSSYSGWPTSYYVKAPATPGSGQYFVMTPVTVYTGTYSAVYNGSTVTATATSTVSQADANTKAQTAWSTQYPTYTGTYPKTGDLGLGSPGVQTVTNTTSQAVADAAAKTQWQNLRATWLASGLSGGTVISSSTIPTTSGWTAATTPSANIKLTFSALATTDLVIDLQYSSTYFIEIVLGGWSNTKSVVRVGQNGAIQSEYAATSPAAPIPDQANAVSYTVTINAGVLTVSATTKAGATSQVLTYTSTILNQTFTGYAFRAYDVNAWSVANTVFATLTFTSTNNGFTATSTVSQADADAKALAAYVASVLTSIGNSKTTAVNAVNTVLSLISTSTTALAAGRQAFNDIATQIDTLAGQVGFTPKLPWQT